MKDQIASSSFLLHFSCLKKQIKSVLRGRFQKYKEAANSLQNFNGWKSPMRITKVTQ